MSNLRIGEVFRYSRVAKDPKVKTVDGYKNYYTVTHTPKLTAARLERGINPLRKIRARDGWRRPAILIRSSPHKVGSKATPWQDFFDTDNGYIRYFGDNKRADRDPSQPSGNKELLHQFRLHSDPGAETRQLSAPLVFFRGIREGAASKGYVDFHGFGVITRVELVTQYRPRGKSFANYAFDFTILNLQQENEAFDWDWISARRNPKLTLEESNASAPSSWREWSTGRFAVDTLTRRVSRLQTTEAAEQRPEAGTKEHVALDKIYAFYSQTPAHKHRFEGLAEVVAARVLSADRSDYRLGWITPPSSDGGSDFVGRLDVGSAFSRARLLVLGQAKCESPRSATSALHLARTVARLKRGWLGVFVTTSHFSLAAQREVIEDRYPIVLIHGLRVAREALAATHEEGHASLDSYLASIDSKYEERIKRRRPEEILYEP